ncbi:MAG: 1,4-dihydroxy-2-naphthoate octaprenyltransferase [Spirochaetota bacterium]
MHSGLKVFLKKWFLAVRPFSFPASLMPLLFGTALAATKGGVKVNLLIFAIALIAMIFLHSATNLLNDYFDYKKKIDLIETPGSGGIMKGLISVNVSFKGAVVLYVAGSLLGLYLVSITGVILFYIGLAGLIVGIFYTQEKTLSLKYSALGDLAVFLNFGILGTLGAWVIQTGSFSWIPVVWALPIGILVIAILHANNWRDIEGDRKGNIKTVAMFLGDRGSLVYYTALLISPFAIILFLMSGALFIDLGELSMPLSFGIVFFALPAAINLIHKTGSRFVPERIMEFAVLDGLTAQFNIIFGLLCLVSALASYGFTVFQGFI